MNEVAATTSKSSKKNKKRKEKKFTELKEKISSKVNVQKEVVEILKSQLNEAKANQNHVESQNLREEIWVLSDAIAGVRTDIPDEELVRIMSSICSKFPQLDDETSTNDQPQITNSINQSSPTTTHTTTIINTTSPQTSTPSTMNGIKSRGSTYKLEMVIDGKGDRRLKKLQDKLVQIECLKERMDRGEALELNQIEKINSESATLQEMKEIEEVLKQLTV